MLNMQVQNDNNILRIHVRCYEVEYVFNLFDKELVEKWLLNDISEKNLKKSWKSNTIKIRYHNGIAWKIFKKLLLKNNNINLTKEIFLKFLRKSRGQSELIMKLDEVVKMDLKEKLVEELEIDKNSDRFMNDNEGLMIQMAGYLYHFKSSKQFDVTLEELHLKFKEIDGQLNFKEAFAKFEVEVGDMVKKAMESEKQ